MMFSVPVYSGRVSGRVKDPHRASTQTHGYDSDVMTKFCWIAEEFSKVLEEIVL